VKKSGEDALTFKPRLLEKGFLELPHVYAYLENVESLKKINM